MDGKVSKVIGDVMKSSRVKQPVIMMVWYIGNVSSGFDIRIVNNFEVDVCSVSSFVAPLADIQVILITNKVVRWGIELMGCLPGESFLVGHLCTWLAMIEPSRVCSSQVICSL